MKEAIEKAMEEYNHGNWSVAIEILMGAREEIDMHIDMHIAWNLWKMQRKEEAVAIWNEIVTVVASNTVKASAYAGLGIYYAEKGNKKVALEHAQLAQDLLPKGATGHTGQQAKNLNACGITMAKIGEFRRAEEILQKVASINEQLEKSDDPETVREATHQRAKNGYNLVSLVHIPQGAWNDAIGELKKEVIPRYIKVGAETDLAAAYHRLAEACEGNGMNDNALRFEKLSLNLWEKHPDPKRAETAQKNIRRIENKIK